MSSDQLVRQGRQQSGLESKKGRRVISLFFCDFLYFGPVGLAANIRQDTHAAATDSWLLFGLHANDGNHRFLKFVFSLGLWQPKSLP